jgi:hypothetical protein
VFWEVKSIEAWQACYLLDCLPSECNSSQAYASGRPTITSAIEDCKQPYEERFMSPDAKESDGTVCKLLYLQALSKCRDRRTGLGWKQHFTDVVNKVADQAFRSNDVTYSRILSLDKQLRHHPVPAPLRWPSTKGAMYQKLGRIRLTGMQCLARIILQESGET